MSAPTLSDHAFALRCGLREAAKTSLQEFESTISDIGYGWLDGYMESVMEGPFKNSIHELMKTPSRTQTVKKTRAITTAAKDRTEMIKRMNALSPLSKASPARQPFSPLQPRSLNIPSPSALLNTPTKGGKNLVKSLGETEKEKEKVVKPKGKVKKGKAKKAVPEEIPEELNTIAESPLPPPSPQIETNLSQGPVLDPVVAVQVTSRPTSTPIPPSPHSHPSVSSLRSNDSRPNADISVSQAVTTEPETKEASIPATEPVIAPATRETAKKVVDLSMIVEAEEEASSRSISSIGNLSVKPESQKAAETAIAAALASDVEVEEEIVVGVHTVAAVHPSTQPISPRSKATGEKVETQSTETTCTALNAPSSIPIDTTSAPPIAEPPAPAPHVPTRQVRSSWLSKALGTGTVPVRLSDDIRKSMAAAPGQKPLDHLEMIRKSLAPVGGLESSVSSGKKRVSEVVLDEEEGRKSKAAKVEFGLLNRGNEDVPVVRQGNQVTFAHEAVKSAPASTAIASGLTTDDPIHAPEVRVPANSTLPSAAIIDNNPAKPAQEASNPTRHRSDIHKVTKALDDLREKAAAKEAQRARAQSIHTPHHHPSTTPGGGGFFRGLGRSLGLTGGRNAEEEAARLERELKEEEEQAEREAREELERLMAEDEGGVRMDVDVDIEVEAENMEVGEQKEEEMRAMKVRDDAAAATLAVPIEVKIVPEVKEKATAFQLAPVAIPTIQPVQPTQVRPTTPPRQLHHRVQQSTTPANTPPRLVVHREEAPAIGGREEKHIHEQGARVPKANAIAHVGEKVVEKVAEQEKIEIMEVDELDDDAVTDEEAEEEEEEEEIEEVEEDNTVSRPLGKSLLSMSTSSQIPHSDMLGRASTIAAKTLGLKSNGGPVKSIQAAAAAAKKEQAANERKALMRDQLEQRRKELAKKKIEEEQLKAEEDKKARIAELEEKKKLRAELEKKRKEREDKIAFATSQAAKAKAEEDAIKKRKFAPMLNKSGPLNPAKKAPPMPYVQGHQSLLKAKEQLRPIKPAHSLAPSGLPPYTSSSTAPKLGPSSFRTIETSSSSQTTSSTITLVTQPPQPRPLGPPSRPSQMAGTAGSNHYPPTQMAGGSKPLVVLQQNRVALQHQLEEKALEVQSEDIDLPDIASEYSDSEDEKQSPDFKRPQWAESPALRQALADQALRNPDELFGAIKPVSMEELFKVKQGKFRARTSSANWSKGDGLTRAEEVEYARRMGFTRMQG